MDFEGDRHKTALEYEDAAPRGEQYHTDINECC